jgi:hypothetical protein
MGGGLLQLVAYGAQDVYLTGNPQITFFKVVYRRHTNFAVESIAQTLNGTAAYGNTVYSTISRNGDLINRAYMEFKIPKLDNYKFDYDGTAEKPDQVKYVNYLGLKLLSQVTIEIGGQQIDKHYSDWMYIWNELSLPLGKRSGYEMMVGADGDVTSAKETVLHVPLEFWFCRNVGLALPLIALQYHEVKLKIVFENKDKCIITHGTGAIPTNASFGAQLWVDYIFLDTDERRRFAQLSHEYLIEQLQFTGSEDLKVSDGNRYRLNFNHPCKELVWVAKPSTANQDWYNYTDGGLKATAYTDNTALDYKNNITNLTDAVYPAGKNPLTKCLLQLNGNDRFAARDGGYFNYVQPYQHHTNIPTNRGINVYSFALKPEEHQPSGTLNMSRIDTAVLSMSSTKAGTIHIYALNYNVLRIMSGMGGLAYSN